MLHQYNFGSTVSLYTFFGVYEFHALPFFKFIGISYPTKKYQPNWASEKDYLRSYSEFIEIIGAKSPGNTVAITPEEYASHLCFYAVSSNLPPFPSR